MVNIGPLTAEIDPVVWGTPANFSGFRFLAALLHGSQVVSVSQILQRWTEGATYVRHGDHHVGHWPTFLVSLCDNCPSTAIWYHFNIVYLLIFSVRHVCESNAKVLIDFFKLSYLNIMFPFRFLCCWLGNKNSMWSVNDHSSTLVVFFVENFKGSWSNLANFNKHPKNTLNSSTLNSSYFAAQKWNHNGSLLN